MANELIITEFARAQYPHLTEKYAHDPNDTPKYILALMFDQNGQSEIPNVGTVASSCSSILLALDKVCQAEWGCSFEDAKSFVTYPPEFRDGNVGKPKKENGRPVPNEFEYNEAEKNKYILSVKSEYEVGVVDPQGNEVDANVIYSGCWVRCQLEISAFMAKNGSAIIKTELHNVQYCYDDESLGGRTPPQPASRAFADKAIENSNVQTGSNQSMRPIPTKPTPPVPRETPPPTVSHETQPPKKPTPPVKKPPQKTVIMNSDSPYTYEQLSVEYGWTDEEIVEGGYGKLNFLDPANG